MMRSGILGLLITVSTAACEPPVVGTDAPTMMDAPGDTGRDAPDPIDAPDDSPPDVSDDAPTIDTGSDVGNDACVCDDGVTCTVDGCTSGTCAHVVDHTACAPGEYCDATSGCRTGGACAVVGDCARPDPCLTVRCDTAMARCVYALLDVDGDGHAPEVCGGDDCNDASSTVYGGADELCDRADQDCDDAIDEDNVATTACGDLSTCTDGFCTCPDELDWCATGSFPAYRCLDTSSDPRSCGYCFNSCPDGVDCVNGACACPEGLTYCSNAYRCVDLATDSAHCGGCDDPCPTGVACVGGSCACPAGTRSCGTSCADLAIDSMNCGACFAQCRDGLTCEGGVCVCPEGGVSCGLYSECGDLDDGLDTTECGSCAHNCVGEGATCVAGDCECPGDRCELEGRFGYTTTWCTDFSTDISNCGGCGRPCPYPQDCVDGVCTGCAEELDFVECDLPVGGLTCVRRGTCPG